MSLFFTLSMRIIPAYAGQIFNRSACAGSREDHPRIRGTNSIRNARRHTVIGSSPHTRDKLKWIATNVPTWRIIPAYAGQIFIVKKHLCPQRDHPRIRGTNLPWIGFFQWRVGSSPHTRDKLVIADKEISGNRIIPAYAGQIPPFYIR